MSCDIHSFCEVKNKKGVWEISDRVFTSQWNNEKTGEPIHWQDYSLFGFLADVRNYDGSEVLHERKGLPKDISTDVEIEKEMSWDVHSHSWFTLKELLDFDYKKTLVIQRDGCENFGKTITYEENLGQNWFNTLEILKTLGEPDNVRIVFWFSS